MTIQQRIVVGAIAIIGFIVLTNSGKNTPEGLTNDKADAIIKEVEKAFDKAEKAVLGSKPIIPDDTPSGPDPDPKKCICQGTGKIVQGDGHVSPCPYHGSKDVPKECGCGCNKSGCSCTNGSCKVPTVQPIQPKTYYYTPQRTRRGIFGGRLFNRG